MNKKQLISFLVNFRDVDVITATLDTVWWESDNPPTKSILRFFKTVASPKLYEATYDYLYWSRDEDFFVYKLDSPTWELMERIAKAVDEIEYDWKNFYAKILWSNSFRADDVKFCSLCEVLWII